MTAPAKIAQTSAGNIVEPSAEDWERATAFVDGDAFKDCFPEWRARHRDSLIRQAAIFEMLERQDREFREAIARSASADERCLAAVEELPGLRAGLGQIAA